MVEDLGRRCEARTLEEGYTLECDKNAGHKGRHYDLAAEEEWEDDDA
jgi:hypothetical protein